MFELCLKLGHPHPDCLTTGKPFTRLSPSQLLDWIAYYELEPFGAFREDYRSARITYLLECVNSKKGRKPKFDKHMFPSKANAIQHLNSTQTDAEMLAIMKAWGATSKSKKPLRPLTRKRPR